MLAKKLGMDPLQLRLKNAVRPGTTMIYGPKMSHAGYVETLEALINHPAYKTPLGPNQGRGVASAIGSMAAANRAPPFKSTRTAPSSSPAAASISAARVPRWR